MKKKIQELHHRGKYVSITSTRHLKSVLKRILEIGDSLNLFNYPLYFKAFSSLCRYFDVNCKPRRVF